MDEVRFIAAIGALGGGVHEGSMQEALRERPHFIAADAGTTDAGPFALGSGKAAFARDAVKRDLAIVLRTARHAHIPVLIGSVGTAGADIHVDWMMEIVREVIREHGWTLKVAVIRSEQTKPYLHTLFSSGRIVPLDPAPHVDAGTIDRSARIVGMMGVEPLQEAIRAGVDLVIAGRCSDPALFAAIPIMHGLPEGLAWHAGKVAECGTMVCETSGKGAIVGYVRRDEAIIRPVGDGLRCTPQSVAAHSLYENGDPYLHKECSGTLDLSGSQYIAVDERTVRITGSAFHPAAEYTVKLEGAELIGHQSVMIGGIRDPYIVNRLDQWLGEVRAIIDRSVERLLGLSPSEWTLTVHVYGRDAIMGRMEPERSAVPHEVGIIVEATAGTQDTATKIAQLARQPFLHHGVPEWMGGITSFACLHNPAHIERGAVYRFNLNHIAIPHTQMEMFRTEIVQLGKARA